MKILQIGLGRWGKNHLRVWNQLGKDVYIAKRHPEQADVCKMYHMPTSRITGDHTQFLADADVVDIVTPPDTHYAFIKEALNAGKDVLVEKPITLKSEQAQELIELAEKQKRILQVGHVFRFSPLTTYIKEQIENGTLGKIKYITGTFAGFRNITPNDCDVLLEHGVHFVDLFNYLAGKTPQSVTAVTSSTVRKGIEDTATLLLHYDTHVAKLDLSYLVPGKYRHLTIVGEKASITADYATQQLELYHNRHEFKDDIWQGINEGILRPKLPSKEPLTEELKHFLDCVENKKKPLADGKAGCDVLTIIEAAKKSAQEGRTVDLT